MTKHYILLSFFYAFTALIFAQNYSVKGRVKDNQGKPLAGVHVFLTVSKKGVATNKEGYFALYSDKDSDILSVSYVGYHNFSQKISSNGDSFDIILQPSNTLLDELVVSNLSATELLKRSIEKIPDNYTTIPFLTKAYYRAKLMEEDTLLYMEETAFEVVKSYKLGFDDEYFLVKNRNFELKENTILRSVGEYDMVQRAKKTFDGNFFKNNDVDYLPGTTFDNRRVYLLSITPKQVMDKRESRIYIDMEDLAFVRFELKMESGDELIAQYRKSDGKYYLTNGYSLHINRRSGRELPAESSMIVTDLIYPFSKEDIEGVHINRKDILKVYATQDQDSIFWSKHNAILPDTAIQQALLNFQQTKREIVTFDSLQSKAFLKRLYEPNLSLIVSTDFTKDFYSLNHNSVSTNRIINHLITEKYNKYGLAISLLYHMVAMPLEETLTEQRLMGLDGLKPKMNPSIFNRANSSYIRGLSDGVFLEYKRSHHGNFMRLHTVRNDGHYVKARMLEERLARADLSNINNKLIFVNIYLLELVSHRIFNTYNPFSKDKKQFNTFDNKQPLLVDRNRSWVRYLFNPDAEFHHHIRKDDLTEEEKKYLRSSSFWSWINLVSPQMYGIPKFKVNEKNSLTFSLNYLRTPFGEMFGQNVWMMHNYNQLHGVFLRQYKNFKKTTLGVGYTLYDLKLFEHTYVTSSLDVWQQPKDFQFKTNVSFAGFNIGQIFEYQFLPHKYVDRRNLSIFIGYDYKTKGYMPESFYLNENFTVKAGVRVNLR